MKNSPSMKKLSMFTNKLLSTSEIDPKKFSKKFDSKVINRQYFYRETRLKVIIFPDKDAHIHLFSRTYCNFAILFLFGCPKCILFIVLWLDLILAKQTTVRTRTSLIKNDLIWSYH
jgi:hypothetical protein